MIKTLIISLLFLIGCASHKTLEWEHSTKTNSFYDEEKCRQSICIEYKAKRIIQESRAFDTLLEGGSISSSSTDSLLNGNIENCMKRKGWKIKDLDYTYEKGYSCY